MKRWSLEVTFEESRAHLGIETQRQWSDRAIERSTPLLFGLYSLVTLGWRGRCTRMGRSLSLKLPGIASTPPPYVPCSLSSGDICGVRGLFPHHPRILAWF
jgi:hypothetical protein